MRTLKALASLVLLAAPVTNAAGGDVVPPVPATQSEAIARIRHHVAEGIRSLQKGAGNRYPFQKAADLRLVYRIRYKA